MTLKDLTVGLSYAHKKGSWLTVQGTMITDIVLAATEFSDFLCPSYDFTPPNLKKNHSCAQFFSMELAAVTEASSSHVTKKCMTSSSASLDEPSPLMRTRQTPHPPGPQQIRWRDTSGEGRIGENRWRLHSGLMGKPDRLHNWRQIWRLGYGHLQAWTNG